MWNKAVFKWERNPGEWRKKMGWENEDMEDKETLDDAFIMRRTKAYILLWTLEKFPLLEGKLLFEFTGKAPTSEEQIENDFGIQVKIAERDLVRTKKQNSLYYEVLKCSPLFN